MAVRRGEFGASVEERVSGRATFEWLEGRLVLIWRANYDHPDLPDSIAFLSCGSPGDRPDPSELDEGCAMHYANQRGVSRIFPARRARTI